MAEPVRAERLDDLADLLDSVVAAFLADVDRHAEPAVARQVDVLADLRVVVPRASRARAGDIDADDPARPIAQRLLDDHHVLVGGERAVHHQEQPGANLRVLERCDVETRVSRRG